MSRFEALITDDGADPALIDEFADEDVNVLVAKTGLGVTSSA